MVLKLAVVYTTVGDSPVSPVRMAFVWKAYELCSLTSGSFE